jgi:hypothetical protein
MCCIVRHRILWGQAQSMRYVAMQLLTWGTIAGAVGSALLLAAMDSREPRLATGLPLWVPLPSEPTQAGRPRAKVAAPSAPSPAASAAPNTER